MKRSGGGRTLRAEPTREKGEGATRPGRTIASRRRGLRGGDRAPRDRPPVAAPALRTPGTWSRPPPVRGAVRSRTPGGRTHPRALRRRHTRQPLPSPPARRCAWNGPRAAAPLAARCERGHRRPGCAAAAPAAEPRNAAGRQRAARAPSSPSVNASFPSSPKRVPRLVISGTTAAALHKRSGNSVQPAPEADRKMSFALVLSEFNKQEQTGLIVKQQQHGS